MPQESARYEWVDEAPIRSILNGALTFVCDLAGIVLGGGILFWIITHIIPSMLSEPARHSIHPGEDALAAFCAFVLLIIVPWLCLNFIRHFFINLSRLVEWNNGEFHFNRERVPNLFSGNSESLSDFVKNAPNRRKAVDDCSPQRFDKIEVDSGTLLSGHSASKRPFSKRLFGKWPEGILRGSCAR
jgi:hypothetical protein